VFTPERTEPLNLTSDLTSDLTSILTAPIGIGAQRLETRKGREGEKEGKPLHRKSPFLSVPSAIALPENTKESLEPPALPGPSVRMGMAASLKS
jgi:hypothetical protein